MSGLVLGSMFWLGGAYGGLVWLSLRDDERGGLCTEAGGDKPNLGGTKLR